MSVTLPLTGSGDSTKVAATDTITGEEYPFAKLVDGTVGSTTKVAAGGGVEANALRVTLASDSTGVVSVDDNGASLTVDNAHLTSLGGAVAGTEVQVDIVAALPAGTNAIGKLAANSGVDIGDVDVTSVVPGTGATNLGKAEDTPHTTGDVGVLALGVRRDATTAAAADGDYTALGLDSGGRLYVNVTGNIGNVALIDEITMITGALPAGTNNIGDVDVLTLPALPAGTNAIGKLAANSGVDIGDVDVLTLPGIAGTVAHDAADSGNPVKVGGKARTTNPTAVADADRVDATFDDIGRQVVVLNQVRDLVGHQHTQIASSSAETTIVTTVAATLLDLTSLVITNATATAVSVTIKDTTAGTTQMILALAASGGIVLNFPVPVKQSVAGNWTATLSSAAVTVNIFAQFVKNV